MTSLKIYNCRAEIADRVPGQDESVQNIKAVSARQFQAITQFGVMLEAALTDSYKVWELRLINGADSRGRRRYYMRLWRDIWQESRKELDLNGLLPNLGATATEFEGRFAEMERLLAGEALQHQPQIIDFSPDQARLHELSHFHKAAFALFHTGLQRLDKLT